MRSGCRPTRARTVAGACAAQSPHQARRGGVGPAPRNGGGPNGAQDAPWIGIDVAKAWLDVASDGRGARGAPSPMTPEGIAALVADPGRRGRRSSIVLEATGGYETAVTAALVAAGLAVVVVNPRQVRDFAKRDRTIGQERCPGCPGLGPVRGPRATPAAPAPGRGGAGIGRSCWPGGGSCWRCAPPSNTGDPVSRPACGQPSMPMSSGSASSSPSWMGSWTRRCAPVRSGGRRRICCAPSPASGRWWRARCWGSCPNWARWIAGRWRRWPGWRP